MSKPVKIDLAQKLVYLNGTPLRLGQYGLDTRTVAVIVQEVINKSELPTDALVRVNKKLDEVAGKELTLCETVLGALMAIHDDEKTLSGKDRADRIEYARRFNKLGKVKVSEGDVKFLMPLVEKYYRGPLVSTQAEDLLKGKEFVLTTTEEEDGEEETPITEVT